MQSVKRGDQLPQTKIKDHELRTIWYLWSEEGLNQQEIAKLFNVHKSTISLILRGLRRAKKS